MGRSGNVWNGVKICETEWEYVRRSGNEGNGIETCRTE